MPMPAFIKASKYIGLPTIDTPPFSVGAYHSHGLPWADTGAAWITALFPSMSKVSALCGGVSWAVSGRTMLMRRVIRCFMVRNT